MRIQFKFLAIGQIVLGALISFASWILGGVKAQIIPPMIPRGDEIILDFIPPDAILETVLLIFGLAVLICGYFQKRAHVKYAGWQLIIGTIIVAISAFLSIRAATLGHGEISKLYYIAYFLLGLGVIVSILGIIQLIIKMLERTKTNHGA